MRTKRDMVQETDIAAAVRDWLVDAGWDVYQEVSLGTGRRTVDLVARRGPVLWAVECKVSLGLAVLEQAHDLIGIAHQTSVAVRAYSRRESELKFARAALAATGIGMFTVAQAFAPGEGGGWVWEASCAVQPRLSRKVGQIVAWGAADRYRKMLPKEQRTRERAYPYLRDLLTEEQRTYAAAGNAHSARWSPWRRTCDQVRAYVAAHPGTAPGAVLAAVQHHYNTEATARGSMIEWVRKGRVPGVEERRSGCTIGWWPSEALVAMAGGTP